MSFGEQLSRHSDAIRSRLDHVRGEEGTKHALVVPLLQVLGYDVYDPREVRPEYTAEVPHRKGGPAEKIDYAVFVGGQPAIFVECKSVEAKLDDHDAQLARYFNATPTVRVGILTNGVRVKVFTDLQQPNIMDTKPWLDVDLLALKPAEVDALKRFRKVDFVAEQVVSLAEEMVFYNAITALLSSNLRSPSEAFVRFLASEIPSVGRVTARVVERLTPIVTKAIQGVFVEQVTRSFATSADAPLPSETPDAASAEQATATPSDAREGVVTTSAELAAFTSISEWVEQTHPGSPIAFRDSKTYASVHQNNVRKWCVRMNVQKPPYWVALRHVKPEELAVLAPGVELLEPGAFGDSRIALTKPEDIAMLRSSIIAAYDREAARRADDHEAEPSEAAR